MYYIASLAEFDNCCSMVWARRQNQWEGYNYSLSFQRMREKKFFTTYFRTWFSIPAYYNIFGSELLFAQRLGQGVSEPSRHAMALGSASTIPHLSNQQHSTWALPTSTRQSLGKTFTRNYPLATCWGHSWMDRLSPPIHINRFRMIPKGHNTGSGG